LFTDVTGDEVWIWNIAFGNFEEANNSDLMVAGPELFLNREGYYEITESSSLVNGALGGYLLLPTYTDLDYDMN